MAGKMWLTHPVFLWRQNEEVIYLEIAPLKIPQLYSRLI